jgi:hypothetical protein
MAKPSKGGDAKLPVYGRVAYDSGVADTMKFHSSRACALAGGAAARGRA